MIPSSLYHRDPVPTSYDKTRFVHSGSSQIRWRLSPLQSLWVMLSHEQCFTLAPTRSLGEWASFHLPEVHPHMGIFRYRNARVHSVLWLVAHHRVELEPSVPATLSHLTNGAGLNRLGGREVCTDEKFWFGWAAGPLLQWNPLPDGSPFFNPSALGPPMPYLPWKSTNVDCIRHRDCLHFERNVLMTTVL